MSPRLMPLTVSLELSLERWDLELEANGRDHHTADLCRERLVVRRGQPFRLTLHFKGRSYEASVDRLTFTVATGKRSAPSPLHLSCSVIPLSPDRPWNRRLRSFGPRKIPSSH